MRGIVLLLPILLGCDAKSSAIEPLDRKPPPVFEGSACEQALAFFAVRCTACHRAEGGQMPPLDPMGVRALSGAQLELIQRKISGTQAPNEGGRMPPNVVLPDEEIAIVTDWIAAGSPVDCEAPEVQPDRHHVDGWNDPSMHGLGLKLAEQNCRDCHGVDFTGNLGPSCDSCHQPGWRTNCTYCHGGVADDTGAPPRDLTGEQIDLSFRAHTSHVSAQNHLPFDCTECHAKPTEVTTLGHVLDGTPARAEVDFSGGRSHEGVYDGDGRCSNLWCHGNGRGPNGSWSHDRGKPTCNDCHAGPNGDPDRLSPPHDKHLEEGLRCAECHGATVDMTGQIIGLDRHVNRQVDLQLVPEMSREGERCSGTCHSEQHDGEIWVD